MEHPWDPEYSIWSDYNASSCESKTVLGPAEVKHKMSTWVPKLKLLNAQYGFPPHYQPSKNKISFSKLKKAVDKLGKADTTNDAYNYTQVLNLYNEYARNTKEYPCYKYVKII